MPPNDGEEPPGDGDGSKVIKVRVRRRDFSEVEIPVVTPFPVSRADNTWGFLGWPHDPSRVGFSIRLLSGRVQLCYNAEFPPFVDLKRRMSKRRLEEEFVRRYQLKLVLHTIFSLNYDFVDDDDLTEDRKARVRNLLCATAESLCLATKSELEIEARMKSQEGGPEGAVTAVAEGGEVVVVEAHE